MLPFTNYSSPVRISNTQWNNHSCYNYTNTKLGPRNTKDLSKKFIFYLFILYIQISVAFTNFLDLPSVLLSIVFTVFKSTEFSLK